MLLAFGRELTQRYDEMMRYVYVSLRDASTSGNARSTRHALLHTDRDIIDRRERKEIGSFRICEEINKRVVCFQRFQPESSTPLGRLEQHHALFPLLGQHCFVITFFTTTMR